MLLRLRWRKLFAGGLVWHGRRRAASHAIWLLFSLIGLHMQHGPGMCSVVFALWLASRLYFVVRCACLLKVLVLMLGITLRC
jgi:hypothetical protein